MLCLAKKLILRASRREICDAERLCTDGARLLEQLRSDGDGFLCLLYVHRVGSMTPCTCTSRTPLRAVTVTRLDVYSTGAASVYSS